MVLALRRSLLVLCLYLNPLDVFVVIFVCPSVIGTVSNFAQLFGFGAFCALRFSSWFLLISEENERGRKREPLYLCEFASFYIKANFLVNFWVYFPGALEVNFPAENNCALRWVLLLVLSFSLCVVIFLVFFFLFVLCFRCEKRLSRFNFAELVGSLSGGSVAITECCCCEGCFAV